MRHSGSSQRRVVVLGASNVVIGMSVMMETARQTWGSPLEVLAAVGHGRSFGRTTRVLGRTLPGILQCDLWEEWQAGHPKPTAALLTDVGNDLMYGSSSAEIADWVRNCLQRLRESCDRIVMTELPLESAATVGPQRFALFRTLFFPGCRIRWQDTLARAEELNARLIELAAEFEAILVRPPGQWYGLDPIHIRRQHRPRAWRQILAPWNSGAEEIAMANSFWQSVRYWHARPKYRRLLGIEQTKAQPALQFPDGTTLSLY